MLFAKLCAESQTDLVVVDRRPLRLVIVIDVYCIGGVFTWSTSNASSPYMNALLATILPRPLLVGFPGQCAQYGR